MIPLSQLTSSSSIKPNQQITSPEPNLNTVDNNTNIYYQTLVHLSSNTTTHRPVCNGKKNYIIFHFMTSQVTHSLYSILQHTFNSSHDSTSIPQVVTGTPTRISCIIPTIFWSLCQDSKQLTCSSSSRIGLSNSRNDSPHHQTRLCSRSSSQRNH